jgi:hypothetical protein
VKKQIKKALVEALRSGKYKQEVGFLHTVNDETGEHAYCATGVLMELAVEAGVAGPAEDKYPNQYHPDRARPLFYPHEINGFSGEKVSVYAGYSLTDEVAEWAGLKEGTLRLPTKGFEDRVQTFGERTATVEYLNDHGFTFEELADLIENNPVR